MMPTYLRQRCGLRLLPVDRGLLFDSNPLEKALRVVKSRRCLQRRGYEIGEKTSCRKQTAKTRRGMRVVCFMESLLQYAIKHVHATC